MLDFTKEVEAVHDSGRVSKARMDTLGEKRVVHIDALGDNWYVGQDGYICSDWRIRNVGAA